MLRNNYAMLERARWLRGSLRIYVPRSMAAVWSWKKGRFAKRQRDKGPRSPPATRPPFFFTGSLTAAIAILAVDFIVGRISFFPLDFWRRLSRSLNTTILFRFRIVIGTPRRTKESTCEQELSRQNYTTSWKWLRKPFIRALPTINTQLHCRCTYNVITDPSRGLQNRESAKTGARLIVSDSAVLGAHKRIQIN